MTVHRLRLVYSSAGSEYFHNWLSTWFDSLSQWDLDGVENSAPDSQINRQGESYYTVDLAFDWSEDEELILDNLDQYLSSYCDWHRVGYHICDHDGETDGCSWDQSREDGSVPGFVPVMQ